MKISGIVGAGKPKEERVFMRIKEGNWEKYFPDVEEVLLIQNGKHRVENLSGNIQGNNNIP